MEPTCYIWHCQRMGWFTTSAQYSTDFNEAKEFSYEAARSHAKAHNSDGIRVLVIREADLVRPT